MAQDFGSLSGTYCSLVNVLPTHPQVRTQTSVPHHDRLASAKKLGECYLHPRLLEGRQFVHYIPLCHILGGGWGLPHGTWAIWDPRIPVQLQVEESLRNSG